MRNRGERSDYVDVLEMEKGREVSFNAASVFLNKISAGNVGVWRSKDLTEATSAMSTVDQLSFYFATVGYFVSLTVIDCTVYLFLFTHILLALASVSLHELGALGSTVSSEWVWGPAIFMYLPPLLEGFLEYGSFAESLKRIVCGFDPMAEVFPAGMFYWLLTLIFFTFQNKTKAAAVRNALVAGTASYKATGRPNANTRLTLLDSFLQYRSLHYTDGVLFLLYYVLYKVSSLGLAGSLPMFTIVFSAVSWLVVPTLFAPYPSWFNLLTDVSAFYDFMMRCPADPSRTELHRPRRYLNASASGKRLAVDVAKQGSPGVPGNLFELLVRDRQEKHEKLMHTWDQDLILLLTSVFQLVLLLMVLPASITESFEFCCVVWCLHCFLVLTFGVFMELLILLVILVVYVLAFSAATDFLNFLLALGLLVQLLKTLENLLLFVTRRIPCFRPDVGENNVHVGMQVIPGKDWMYDMKKDDEPQNSAQGSSMVGTVTDVDGKSHGFCSVKWLSGVEGRYRISTASTSATDLKVHPSFSAVVVEASVLLFGHYHQSLFVALVVCITHFLVSCLLILLDLPCFGCLHSKMLRLPTATELETASQCGWCGGPAGMPPMALAARGEEVRICDLPRGSWKEEVPKPPDEPVPPTYVSLSDKPTYRGSEWTAMCRLKLTKRALDDMQKANSTTSDVQEVDTCGDLIRMSHSHSHSASAKDLGEKFQILPVSVEKDGQAYPLDHSLPVGSYLVFAFADERGELFQILENLTDKSHHIDPASSSTESVERLWVPVYKFEVPTDLWSNMQADVDKHMGETERHPEHMRFCIRARDLGRQQDMQTDQANDLLLLSQGSWKEFKLVWAQQLLKGCTSTGFKQVYSISPRRTLLWAEHEHQRAQHQRLGEGFELKERWPLGGVIRVVRLDPSAVLFAFQNEKPADQSLKVFVSMFLDPESDLDEVISTKWVPVFNFLVPTAWIMRSVGDVAEDPGVIVCGIRRFHGSGSRAIWFPSHKEKFGERDEIILPFGTASLLFSR